MSKVLELYATELQFRQLHQAVDATRESSDVIKVPRRALVNLLMDHSRLLKEVPHREPEEASAPVETKTKRELRAERRAKRKSRNEEED